MSFSGILVIICERENLPESLIESGKAKPSFVLMSSTASRMVRRPSRIFRAQGYQGCISFSWKLKRRLGMAIRITREHQRKREDDEAVAEVGFHI